LLGTLSSAWFLVFIGDASLANYSGRVFDTKSGELLFVFRHDEQHLDGDEILSRETYLYPTLAAAQADGLRRREATVEESISENGVLQLYTFEQKQRKQSATVEVDHEIIYYTWADANGRKEEHSAAPAHVVTTTTAQAYVISRWGEVEAGESLPARMVIPWKFDTYGATFTRRGNEVGLRPSNPILALLAGPIFFRVSGTKIVSYHGPVMVSRREGTSWKTLTADVLYDR
jgi:hypothetical protein